MRWVLIKLDHLQSTFRQIYSNERQVKVTILSLTMCDSRSLVKPVLYSSLVNNNTDNGQKYRQTCFVNQFGQYVSVGVGG